MTFRILWSYPALHQLQSLHWLRGAEVDGAVQRFAEKGTGIVERIPEHPALRVLHAGAHRAVLRLDLRERTLLVVRLHR